MTRYFKYIALAAAALLALSCTLEYMAPDQNGLPVASELTPVITVDQQTNYVTFSIAEAGVVPLWIFPSDQAIDGKNAGKIYAYTGNGIRLRIREEGTHEVELKAYNANGISQGSQMLKYTLDQTYRDPFDPSPYMKAISGSWIWDSETPGHFGCGETIDNPTGWWSCEADGKKDMGLYDDVMSFDEGGSYTFDPGAGGTVYVNWNSGFKPEGHSDEIAAQADYQAPVEKFTSTYSVENDWNGAGIEEIFLVLKEGDYLSYIPHSETYTTNTRYQFVETATSKIKKNLQLVWYTPTGNGGGPIAWKYSFVPYVKGLTPEEMLAGTDSAGKVWIMDNEATGHLACGPSLADPSSWWAAKANEKTGTGMYDNELTFCPDGTYRFSPGEDESIYVNWGCTTVGPNTGAEPDNIVAWTAQEGKYTFDGENLVLPANFTLGYIPSDECYANPAFVVTKITETELVLVYPAACSWQYIFKARDIKGPEMTFAGVGFEGKKANVSLTKDQTCAVTGIDLSQMWIDPDFFEYIDASTVKFTAVSGDYQIMYFDNWLKVCPMSGSDYATYNDGALWIIGEGIAKPKGGTIPGWNTGAAVDIPFAQVGEHKYQLTAYVTGPNFKIFGQADWGKEFTGTDYGTVQTNGFFTINGYPDGAAEDSGNIWSGSDFAQGWYVFDVTDNSGVLDMTVTKAETVKTVYDIEGATNLWRKATITPEYWYSGGDWQGGVSPDAEMTANNGFLARVPTAVGGSEWMAQNKLHAGFATQADVLYDFCCTLKASADCVVTIKLTGNPEADGDVNAFFYDQNVQLTAGEPLTYYKEKISQKVGNADFTVIFDYGRCPGITIEATEICFQEHKEQVVPMQRKR